MARKAYLANYYSSDELKQKYTKNQDLVEARRWHLLWGNVIDMLKAYALAIMIGYIRSNV